jgi:benzoyl-CoA-dihydrodiol lyase
MTASSEPRARLQFETHPSRYRHWKLRFDKAGPEPDAPEIAHLTMSVVEDAPLHPGYTLKLNSYDLGVDVELCDAIQRLRFEHPQVRAVVVGSDRDRVFCAGANIFMLAQSTHPFKVNFCKYTNETRLGLEEASALSGQKYVAALNGTCAGGGYELALACDEIWLVDDGSSAVSLPETPLLGVLPGTGGLTRLVDKRRVRRDLADVFVTLAEGIKGKRAVEWRLVDGVASRSKFGAKIDERARSLAAAVPAEVERPAAGVKVELEPVAPSEEIDGDRRRLRYRHVELRIDSGKRLAELTIHGPEQVVDGAEAILKAAQAGTYWPLRAYRELDHALLELRLNHEEIGLVVVRTRGDLGKVLKTEAALFAARKSWIAREVILQMARTLRRLDLTSKSFFAVVDPGSCFGGSLLDLALGCDRIYTLDDADRPVAVAPGALQGGALPMSHGLTRLQARFYGTPERVQEIAERIEPALGGKTLGAEEATELGLSTVTADAIDFDDELRVAVEERLSLSPDALTGTEAQLRFPGPETGDTKIFGRLSAWQNWIFYRPNATGESGALTLYGKPQRPSFDWRRT